LPQNEQEMTRISKNLLKKIDPKDLQVKNQVKTHGAGMETKESQTLDFIKRMKREKSLKIYRAFRAYKFRQTLKRRIAARKILHFLVKCKKQSKSVLVQTYLRSYLAR
jgi:hypothetical protein